MRILLISGSLRLGSTSTALLRAVAAVAAPGVRADLYGGMARLPHFNPDDDVDPLPHEVTLLREAIGASDLVLFSTPEYAGALPGSLKNLLDWTIGGGQIYEKPVAWINASPGADLAHAELRTVLGFAGTKILHDACTRIHVTRADVDDRGAVASSAVKEQACGALVRLLEAVS